VIIDFDLKTAIHKGLVKMIAIDKRKEIATTNLDFKAIKDDDGKKVLGLSEGQKLMLRAGITKLNILNEEFSKEGKHPKMMVICEDTKVAPYVHEFLVKDIGLLEDDMMEIHSNRKGEVDEKEWKEIKQKLFNIDDYDKPKVIISVLMLREGFDVNNISVIVPLRSAEASILLEQTIGRGLRLMWREPAFEDIKREMRRKVLIEKKEPENHLDLLSIVEHPAFEEFYETFIDGEMVVEYSEEIDRRKVLGDMITVGLRDDYKSYDFYWPIILREREEILSKKDLTLDSLESYNLPFSTLETIKGKGGETFIGHELTVGTQFGEYDVKYDISPLFTANSYNEFIVKIIDVITTMMQPVKRKTKNFPIIQVKNAELVAILDEYIRRWLFVGENNELIEFDPLKNENWKILVTSEEAIAKHIIKNVSKKIYEMQTNVDVHEAEVSKIFFSIVGNLRMRENYSIEVSKSIYKRLLS
jgi:type III restriction enzyme